MEKSSFKKLIFKEKTYAQLMKHRIYNVLLYASKYDAFMLEEDGRIDEQIFFEYTSLNLRYPPRFTLVNNQDEANAELSTGIFDLVISMPSGESVDPFTWAKEVKMRYPDLPFVVLTPFSRSVSQHIAGEDLSGVDYVFSWLGNPDLLLAITKMLEDKMNIKEDIESVGVQTILFVEDSIRFYSSLLPHIYKCVFKQSMSFKTEALNEHEQMLRLRGRPKIMFARNYEEAIVLFEKYKNNLLGVITDVSYNKDGIKDKKAGFDLCRVIRNHDKHLPIIVQSTDLGNSLIAAEMNADFLHKNSSTMLLELRDKINLDFGFSDFIFYNPLSGEEEGRAKNLKGLQEILFRISDESLSFHVHRNDFSRWLYSRAMFPLAHFLQQIRMEDMGNTNMETIRQMIFDAIVQYRLQKNRGVVADFQRDRFDRYSNFARIGEGSMGGKGRGLAFVDAMIKRHPDFENYENAKIKIPKTVVICTDLFQEFMERNGLYPIALSEESDEVILNTFLKAHLPKNLIADLNAFVQTIQSPIAVRSSSLLEDSHYQPFAGIYSTYMVPFDRESKTNSLSMLTEAIKAVYASVYYRSSKSYMKATKNLIDEEQMAIVLQETCGTIYGEKFYPSFSGVARSLNYYPIDAERPEEGIANIALGLGKYIVDGGLTLRFSPAYPQKVLQLSNAEYALKETQTHFYALDISPKPFVPKVDDGFNLLKIPVQVAYGDGTLKYIASTYSYQDQNIYDGLYDSGRKIISFANILKHEVFPLADILRKLLKVAVEEMGRHIEIEFAVQLDYKGKNHIFYLLQIRPIVENKEIFREDLNTVPEEKLLLKSFKVMGHGLTDNVFDIIYVRPEKFNAMNSEKIKNEIDSLNREMIKADRNYILIGPGRWGSTDPWLGIPVKWPHISQALAIVESGISHLRVEPSQGTHFFQNLTSFGVSYFTLHPYLNDGHLDFGFLDTQTAAYESENIRHIRFDNPMHIKVDARNSVGIIQKPEE